VKAGDRDEGAAERGDHILRCPGQARGPEEITQQTVLDRDPVRGLTGLGEQLLHR
jgi:hypothetical protein